ncbi:phosphotransferase [Paenibacillus sp. P26]|nr:phosphotransferase [Paenibacillus sp. P26]
MQNGKQYYVTEWIQGRRMTRSSEELAQLGSMLAKLHSVSRNLKLPPPPISIIRKLTKNFAAFRRRLKKVKKKPTNAGRWARDHGEACIELSRAGLQALRGPELRALLRKENRHPALVHGDVTIPNVLVANGRVYLIDWDLMGRGASYYDLVVALTNTAGFSPARIAAFLRGYEQVRPLSRSEKKLVSALYRIPREAWYVCQYAANGLKHGQLLHNLDRTWSQRLEAVRWLDAWANS